MTREELRLSIRFEQDYRYLAGTSNRRPSGLAKPSGRKLATGQPLLETLDGGTVRANAITDSAFSTAWTPLAPAGRTGFIDRRAAS